MENRNKVQIVNFVWQYDKLTGKMNSLVALLLTLTTIFQSCDKTFGLPSTLQVGIVLPEEHKGGDIEFGYNWGLQILNKDPILLPNTTLIPKTIYVKAGDTFRASKELCRLLGTGVVALLGGASDFDPSLEWKLFWTSASLDVPLFFSTPSYSHYKPLPKVGSEKEGAGNEFAVRLSPSIPVWGQLLRELAAYLRWDSVAILYENEKGLLRTQALLREPAPVDNIIVRKINRYNIRYALAEVKGREIRHMIIDCKLSSLPDLLRGIVTLQMTDYKFHYVLTNMDLSTADMSGFIRSNVNVTSFQIINQESRYLREKWNLLRDFGSENFNTTVWDSKHPQIMTETAFAFDSVSVLGLGLAAVDASHTIRPANLSCDNGIPWTDGLSLLNYITTVDFKGMSGPIAFKEGDRSSMKIEVTRLTRSGWKKVGKWTPESSLNITKPKAFWDAGLANVTLVVSCVLEEPYVRLARGNNLTGNARFEGFSVDLLRIIAEIVGFKYVLEVVPDGKYGAYDPDTGEWNGVVKQLIDKSVDLAIGAITINHARESVIDFTKPFMNLGISILFKVPDSPETTVFSFLNPLALEIWISVGVSYLLVGLTMFVVARFSPNEWSATTAAMAYAQHSAVGVVRNQFTISNALWYPIGTLMQQGSDLNPKTASTRIVGGIWWFFSIIIVSSYTANLAAFLTVERMSTPIESVEDLAEQSEISYGTLEAGSTMAFFMDSKIETYQKMWRFMESRKPSVFTKSYAEGIERVLEGNYAFLMESTTTEYVMQQNCNLTQIGGLLDSKGFGIALPIGSPWRDKISLAILELQENDMIRIFKYKWWVRTSNTDDDYHCNKDSKHKDTTASALGVDSIGGVFVVLLVGLVISIVVAMLEFCWNAKMNANVDQVALCSEMAEEAKFAFKCRGPRRRPAFIRHCGRCQGGSTRSHPSTAYHDHNTYPHEHSHNHLSCSQ